MNEKLRENSSNQNSSSLDPYNRGNSRGSDLDELDFEISQSISPTALDKIMRQQNDENAEIQKKQQQQLKINLENTDSINDRDIDQSQIERRTDMESKKELYDQNFRALDLNIQKTSDVDLSRADDEQLLSSKEGIMDNYIEYNIFPKVLQVDEIQYKNGNTVKESQDYENQTFEDEEEHQETGNQYAHQELEQQFQKPNDNNNNRYFLPQDDQEDHQQIEINRKREVKVAPLIQNEESKPFQYQLPLDNEEPSIENQHPHFKLSDEAVLKRLPEEYFVKDVEYNNLDHIMNSLHQMRKEVFTQMNDKQIKSKINELETLMTHKEEQSLQKNNDKDTLDLNLDQSLTNLSIGQKFGDQDIQMKEQVQPVKGISPQNDKEDQFEYEEMKGDGNIAEIRKKIKDKRKIQIINNSGYPSVKSSQSNLQPASSIKLSNRTLNQNESIKRIKLKQVITNEQGGSNSKTMPLRMADYFKDNKVNIIQSPLLSPTEKESLKLKMEEDILQQIDINYLFNNADNLRFGLIDQKRIYKIMQKIKELVNKEKNREEIDVDQIVKYLQQEELFTQKKHMQLKKQQSMEAIEEPDKSKIPIDIGLEKQWLQVIEFMKNNPKVLLKMLQDQEMKEKDPEERVKEIKIKQIRNLSQTFAQSRKEFLEAIDKIQQRDITPLIKNGQKASINKNQKIKTSARRLELRDETPQGSPQKQQKHRIFVKRFHYSSLNTPKIVYQSNPFKIDQSFQKFKEKTLLSGHKNLNRTVIENNNGATSPSNNTMFININNESRMTIPIKPQSKISHFSNHITQPTTTNLGGIGSQGHAAQPSSELDFQQLSFNLNIQSDQHLNHNKRPITAPRQMGRYGLQQRRDQVLELQNQRINSQNFHNPTVGYRSALQRYQNLPQDSLNASAFPKYVNNEISQKISVVPKVNYQTITTVFSPSRKTNDYIQKIAPRLREGFYYSTILSQSQVSARSQLQHSFQEFHHQRKPERFKSQLKKRKLATTQHTRRRTISDQFNTIEMQQERESNNLINLEIKKETANREHSVQCSKMITPRKPLLVDQTMQTQIGGLENYLLVSAKNGVIDPFEGTEEKKQEEENIKVQQIEKVQVVIKPIDWHYAPLFTKVINDDLPFNKDQNMNLYVESEVDYILNMMNAKFKDFKRSDIIRPFLLKAQSTLKKLSEEQQIMPLYEKYIHKYEEITIENTMKLLIRCKYAFGSRNMIIEILQLIVDYELKAIDFKNLIDSFDSYKVSEDSKLKIQEQGEAILEKGHNVIVMINRLLHQFKHFKSPFIFKNKVTSLNIQYYVQDYVMYVKNEMMEIKRLIKVYQVRKLEDEQVSIHQQSSESDYDEEDDHQ